MGLFDLFGREPKDREKRELREERRLFTPETEEKPKEKKDGPIAVFVPTSFSDVEKVIDKLREGKNAIVHLNNLKKDTAVRVLDLLSGAIYALGGGIYEMEKEVFMFSPSGLEID